MTWKKKLKMLEQNKKWNDAIKLMNDTIKETPDNIEIYIYFLFFFMNISFVDGIEKYAEYYSKCAKECFQQSYLKFQDVPEYLFFAGIAVIFGGWLFNIDYEYARKMLDKAAELEPNNILYQWTTISDMQDSEKAYAYARMILNNKQQYIKKCFKFKGKPKKQVLGLIVNWSKTTLIKKP